MEFPEYVNLPLSMSIGKPSIPIVTKLYFFNRGQMIAKPDGFMSVPVHASITGTVTKIKLAKDTHGGKSLAITIKQALSSTQERMYEPIDINSLSVDEIISRVQGSGLVGLGGACFPTHVKLSPPKEHTVHTVLVNGCECEPFLTTDHRIMLERVELMVQGIRVAMKCTGASKAIIGLEDNKHDAFLAMKQFCVNEEGIEVTELVTKYPQGSEKMLASALLGVEIPSGSIPSSVGLAVFNVATLSKMAQLLALNTGLVERVVTITGAGITYPGNYIIPLGTSIKFALKEAGFTGDVHDVVLGGPMMGLAVSSLDIPIVKGTSAILVLSESMKYFNGNQPIDACIKCSFCLQACPLYLNPSQLGILARNERYEEMEEDYHLNDCFECGSCSSICPAHIPLVQLFRVAKNINRKNK